MREQREGGPEIGPGDRGVAALVGGDRLQDQLPPVRDGVEDDVRRELPAGVCARAFGGPVGPPDSSAPKAYFLLLCGNSQLPSE